MIIRTAPKDVSVSLLEKRRTQAIELQKDRRKVLLQQLREIDSSPDITNISETLMETSSPDINDSSDTVAMVEREDENEVAAMSDTKMDQDETDERQKQKREREIIIRGIRKHNRALKYSNLFMIPEWLIETPKDFGEEWTVMARPEGQRCLVRSRSGKTVCRGKHGGVMFYFKSRLPSGSLDQQKGEAILDCVWHKASETFFVVDVILWNGVKIGQKFWDFRSSWRESMIAELQLSEKSSNNEFIFRTVPCLQSNPNNLRKAYQETSYNIDGLLFYHLKNEYCSGPTPLVHFWKDSKCSKWYINSSDGKKKNKYQSCALELKGSKEKGWWLESREGFHVAKVRNRILSFKSRKKNLVIPKEGSILKWKVRGVNTKRQKLKFWQYLGLAHNRKKPDLYSKIAFQYLARSGCGVSFEALETATKSNFVDSVSRMKDLLMAV